MKKLFTILFLVSCFLSEAQDVSGLYLGTTYNDTTKITQSYEIALSEYKGKITGYAYTTYVANDTFYYGIRRVKGMKKDNQLIIEDQEMLAHNSPVPPNKGVRRLTVIPLNSQDSIVNLQGAWYTTPTRRFISITGSMALKKDSDSSNSALIAHLTELKLLGVNPATAKVKIKEHENKTKVKTETAAAKVKIKTEDNEQKIKVEQKKELPKPVIIKPPVSTAQRTLKTLQTVYVTGDTLLISLYDNGVVDGDTVSVHLNGQQLLTRVRLTETFEKKKVVLSPLMEENEFILIADNLGTLPPNTGLLVIQDGATRHPVYFSADLQTNARILIRKRK